jgi:putative toxin-antitoxin system antitoxin component (TIGR02293 family)
MGRDDSGRALGERAARAASVAALAEQTFADREKAQSWLRRPTSALNDRRPIDLLDSEPGARVVEQLLHRIAHGIAA